MRKTVIITGGSGGIGSACARAFHKKEYNVVVGYSRSEDKAKALIGEINLDGGSAIAVKADLTERRRFLPLRRNDTGEWTFS